MAGLVSVVIPVHQGERFLADAIDSALAQTYRPIEIIVVDDGSTDGSGDVARRYPEVRLLTQEQAGPSAARNAAFAVMSGEYVALLDADDIWNPDKLDLQVGHLESNPGAALVLAHHEDLTVDDVAAPLIARNIERLGIDRVAPISVVARREVVEAIGGFDERLRTAEDTDWLIRAREAGLRMDILDRVVMRRRFHGGNLTYDTDAIRAATMRSLHHHIRRGRPAQPEGQA